MISHGFVSFSRHLFGYLHGNRGRAADGHDRIYCCPRPADNHATKVDDRVKSREICADKRCNTEGDGWGRPLEAERQVRHHSGRPAGFANKGRDLHSQQGA